MTAAEPVRSVPDQAADLEAALSEFEGLLHQLGSQVSGELPEVVATLEPKLRQVRERAADLARALQLWADPETQERAARFRSHVAAGEPIASVRVDEVVDELQRRRKDIGV